MAYKTPAQATEAAVEAGVAKANAPFGKLMVGGFLAGAYIAFGSLLAIAVTSGLNPQLWGTLPTLVFGAVFSLGLILVILAGSDLLTGNMALLPVAAMAKRLKPSKIPVNWAIIFVANFVGSLFVAYVLAVKTGVIGTAGGAAPGSLTFARLSGIAHTKAITESDTQIFLRAIACNWLVCLAVWLAMAAEDIGGKILGIFFPITAFVAMGFDHVVANMFFLPAAMFAHVPDLTWAHVANNIVFAFLGNVVGAVVFVAGSYYYLYLRGKESSGANAVEAGGRGGVYPGERGERGFTGNGTEPGHGTGAQAAGRRT